jgi:uncharacterized membrane protein YgcG
MVHCCTHHLMHRRKGYFLMLGSLRATVCILVLWVALVDMRTAAAFAPRIIRRARLSPSLATTQRWMSNPDDSATQVQSERSEEEKAAAKAAREARKYVFLFLIYPSVSFQISPLSLITQSRKGACQGGKGGQKGGRSSSSGGGSKDS